MAADVGATLRLAVTATGPDGTVTALSAVTGVVAPLAPRSTAPPLLSGTPKDLQALSATPGVWNGTTPLAYAYRWLRCDATGLAYHWLWCSRYGDRCRLVEGATKATYELRRRDLRSGRLRRSPALAVTATNAAGDTTAVTRAIGARRRPAARRVSIGPEAPLRGRRLAVTLACADGPARCGGTLSVGEPAMPVSVPAGEALTVVLRVPRRTAGEVAARFTSDGRASGRFTAATINVT